MLNSLYKYKIIYYSVYGSRRRCVGGPRPRNWGPVAAVAAALASSLQGPVLLPATEQVVPVLPVRSTNYIINGILCTLQFRL